MNHFGKVITLLYLNVGECNEKKNFRFQKKAMKFEYRNSSTKSCEVKTNDSYNKAHEPNYDV